MVKTTIYFPDDLKRDIEAAAKREGISEAELIREAVAARVRQPYRRPRLGMFSSGRDFEWRGKKVELEGFGEYALIADDERLAA